MAAPAALSGIPEKSSEKQGVPSSLLPSILPSKLEEPSERKRVDLPAPDWGLWTSFTEAWWRLGAKLSLKANHWLWVQHREEKASTLFGGLEAVWPLMGSTGLLGRVMGALWALSVAGLCAWKGSSGESQGEDEDEEKADTPLGCWVSATGDCSCSCTVLAEDGDVIDRPNKHVKNNSKLYNCTFKYKKTQMNATYVNVWYLENPQTNREKAFLPDNLINEAHTSYLKLLAESHPSHSSEKVEMEGWKGR